MDLAAATLTEPRMELVAIVKTEERWGWGLWLTFDTPILRRSETPIAPRTWSWGSSRGPAPRSSTTPRLQLRSAQAIPSY